MQLLEKAAIEPLRAGAACSGRLYYAYFSQQLAHIHWLFLLPVPLDVLLVSCRHAAGVGSWCSARGPKSLGLLALGFSTSAKAFPAREPSYFDVGQIEIAHSQCIKLIGQE